MAMQPSLTPFISSSQSIPKVQSKSISINMNISHILKIIFKYLLTVAISHVIFISSSCDIATKQEVIKMIITAASIKVGTQLAEADGYLFDVVEIVKETEKSITVRLCSDFSSFQS